MVLVSILGDFHSSILPIFYNFKDDITKHILIHDDFKRDVTKAKELLQGLERFKQKYNYTFELIEYTLDEDSYEDIDKCSLNHNLMSKGAQFLAYDMYENDYNVLNTKNLTKYKILNNLNIEDHFLLKGYYTEAKEFKEFANTHEKIIKSIFEEQYEQFDSYVKLPRGRYKTVNHLPNGSIKRSFISLGLKDLDAHNSLLTGGLFEYYIYNLLKDLDYDDIEVGMIVSREYNHEKVPNEFDILIMKNNHLHTIECKYRNNVDMNELIYKYTALTNVVDEDGTTIIILKNPIHYENTDTYNKGSFTPLRRAALNNITFKGGVHLNSKLFSMYIKCLLDLRG